MKRRNWMALCCGVLALEFLSVAVAGTNEIFQLKGVIQGVIQFGTCTGTVKRVDLTVPTISCPSNTVSVINKVQITENDLVNLALGRDLGTPVAANEVIALSSGCGSDEVKFVVFDTSGSSNLATIAELDLLAQANWFAKRRRVEMRQFVVPGSGGPTNALSGGTLLIDVNSTIDTNGCVHAWNGSLFGVLSALLPANTCTNVITNVISGEVTNSVTNCPIFGIVTNFDVIISKTSYTSTGKKIGTVVDEP